jgi:hypothetical protein
VTAVLALGALLPAQEARADVLFNHQPPVTARAGEPLSLNGTALNADGPVYVYYRTAGEGSYDRLEARAAGGVLDATLPGWAVEEPGVEYFLAAADPSGEYGTWPEGVPGTDPFMVQVGSGPFHQATGGSGGGEPPRISILSPEEGSTEDVLETVIVASFYDPDGDLTADGIKLFVNGVDRTAQATVTGDLLTWVPPDVLPSGVMEFEVRAVDAAGNAAEPATSSFFKSTEARVEAMGLVERLPLPEGRAALDMRFTGLDGAGASSRQEPPQTIIGRIDGRGSIGLIDYKGKVFVTSDEESNAQPRNRYRLELDAGRFEGAIGDVNPRFNPLVLWGKRVRGFEVSADLLFLDAQYTQGKTKRGIEGTSALDTIPSSTGADSVITVVADAGTYERTLQSLRTGLGLGRSFDLQLTVLKVKDDVESIQYGVKPKDNVVLGLDWGLAMFGRRIQLDAAAGYSFVTEDISGGAISEADIEELAGEDVSLPFNPEDIEDIIVLNSSTTPLNLSDLSNLAVQSTARGNLFGHLFEARWQRVGAVYRSYGAPSLLQDKQGYKIKDSFGLFRRQLLLSGDYEFFQDNVSKDKENTKETSVISGNASWVPPEGWLTGISVGYRLYARDNGDTTAAAGVKDDTNLLTFGAGVRFPVMGYSEEVRFSYLTSKKEDDISIVGENEGSNFMLESITTFPILPLKVILQYGTASNEYPGLPDPLDPAVLGQKADYTTLLLGGEYRLLDDRMLARGSWRKISGEGNLTGANSDKSYFTLGADLTWWSTQKAFAEFGTVSYDDKSANNLDYDETIWRFGVEQRF